jgi:putative Mg2+ transporter-C (MgtC) family protein
MIKQQYSPGSLTVIWRLTGKNTRHEEVIRHLVDDPKIKAYQF